MMPRMRASPAHSYSGRSPTMASPTVASSRKSSDCPSTPTRTAPFLSTRPSSGSSLPASRLSRVDLPSPLRPTMPTRSPSSTPSDTLSNTVFVGNSTRTFSHPSRNAMPLHPSSPPSAGDYSARTIRREESRSDPPPIRLPQSLIRALRTTRNSFPRPLAAPSVQSPPCRESSDFWPRNPVLARMPPSSTQKRYPHLGKAQVDEFCYGKSALRRTRSVPKLDLLAKNRGFPCTQSPSTLLKHIAHIPRPTPAHTPPASRHWHNKANPPHTTLPALRKPQTGVFAAPGRTRLGSKPRERRLASMLTSEKRPLLADTRPLSTIAPVHAAPLSILAPCQLSLPVCACRPACACPSSTPSPVRAR